MQKGFTLIEMVIYIALFSIVIGGGMVATHQIIEGTSAGTNHVILQEEANFLLRKINWALTGAKTISISGGGKTLYIEKYDGSNYTFTFDPTDGIMELDSQVLNSSSIDVGQDGATHIFLDLTNGVKATFTLTTVQNSRNISQTFTTTKYLRQ